MYIKMAREIIHEIMNKYSEDFKSFMQDYHYNSTF